MSSSYVRKKIKTWIDELAYQPLNLPNAARFSMPYYDTVNRAVTPRDDKWFTIEYEIDTSGIASYDRKHGETGRIGLIFNIKPGDGSDVLDQCEADALLLFRKTDNTGALSFIDINSPEQYNQNSTRYFQVIIDLEYQYYSDKGK